MSVPLCLLTDELLHCLNNCQASWIFTTPALYNRVVEAAAKASVSIKVGLHVIHSSETLLVGHFFVRFSTEIIVYLGNGAR